MQRFAVFSDGHVEVRAVVHSGPPIAYVYEVTKAGVLLATVGTFGEVLAILRLTPRG